MPNVSDVYTFLILTTLTIVHVFASFVRKKATWDVSAIEIKSYISLTFFHGLLITYRHKLCMYVFTLVWQLCVYMIHDTITNKHNVIYPRYRIQEVSLFWFWASLTFSNLCTYLHVVWFISIVTYIPDHTNNMLHCFQATLVTQLAQLLCPEVYNLWHSIWT